MNNSIFMEEHTDKNGRTQPIVSMTADHLINYIRFRLVKLPHDKLERTKAKLLNGFAPADMDERTRKIMGLREMTPDDEQAVLKRVEQLEIDLINEAFQEIPAYLVIAYCRDDTHLAVREILQQVTGITGAIALPQFTSYAVMSAEEAAQLGTGEGLVGIDDPDYDPQGWSDEQPRTWGDL